jgi:cobalt/nickel transport system permease protein
MHSHWLEPLQRSDSAVRRLPAALKLLTATAMIVAIVVWPPQDAVHLIWPAAFLIFLAAISRIPAIAVLRRLLILEPFVIGAALLALFGPGGWRFFVLLLIKCTLCLATAILLAATTPFPDTLQVLRSVHVPRLLVTTLALMHRYLFVLADESHRMKRARASRTFVAGRRRQWRATSTVAAQLFIRASERAERVYAAMCARGWR